MENRITGKRPQPILDDEDEIITDNQQVMELNSAVDNLLAVTQGGLLQKALALSNEKCNNLERLNREQRKVRERLERERRERDEKAGKTDGQSNGNDGEGDERSSYSYGKGD